MLRGRDGCFVFFFFCLVLPCTTIATMQKFECPMKSVIDGWWIGAESRRQLASTSMMGNNSEALEN